MTFSLLVPTFHRPTRLARLLHHLCLQMDQDLTDQLDFDLIAADVWVTYYNEFRPHECLGDKTPMEFGPRIFNSVIFSFGLST